MNQKSKLLSTILKEVKTHGWTNSSIENSLKKEKINRLDFNILFPGGIDEVIEFFLESIDKSMKKYINKNLANTKSITKKVADALKYRFVLFNKKKLIISKTIPYIILKPHLLVKLTWKTSDLIWRAIADNSTDFNYYTKRSTLALIYTSTLAYWVENKNKTQEINDFIDRRIANLISFGIKKGKLKNRIRKYLPETSIILSKLNFMHK